MSTKRPTFYDTTSHLSRLHTAVQVFYHFFVGPLPSYVMLFKLPQLSLFESTETKNTALHNTRYHSLNTSPLYIQVTLIHIKPSLHIPPFCEAGRQQLAHVSADYSRYSFTTEEHGFLYQYSSTLITSSYSR